MITNFKIFEKEIENSRYYTHFKDDKYYTHFKEGDLVKDNKDNLYKIITIDNNNSPIQTGFVINLRTNENKWFQFFNFEPASEIEVNQMKYNL